VLGNANRDLNLILVKRFEAWLFAQQYSPITSTRYVAIARRFATMLDHRSVTTTTHKDVQEHLSTCARTGQTAHLLQIELFGLRSFFDFLNLGGLMNWVPPRLVRLRYTHRRLPIYLSERNMRKLFKAAKDLRERFVLEFLYGTGCRSCELSSMRIEDIDFAERRVRVSSKPRPFRTLMIPPRVLKTLRRYIANRKTGYVLADGRPLQALKPQGRRGSWYVYYRTYDERGKSLGLVRQYIPASEGKRTTRDAQLEILRRAKHQRHQRPLGMVPISPFGIHAIVRRIGIRVGLRVYPRMLRHSLATHLMDKGGDLRLVSDCLGHSSMKSTIHYLHVSRRAMQQNFERLNPLNFLEVKPCQNIRKRSAH
jgi:site-specific recombinase XerD